MGIVEKRDPVLGLQEPRDLSGLWGPRNPWDPKTLSTSRTCEPSDPWDLRTSGPLGNYLYRLKFRI